MSVRTSACARIVSVNASASSSRPAASRTCSMPVSASESSGTTWRYSAYHTAAESHCSSMWCNRPALNNDVT